ncbi:uncharacterized protein METZ01_LOCUS111531 [marine metagenome]|uniref:Uncharacterized protein n=1 Tax=marine metagenome TaxID=408172 RepID=A0A381X3D0_9ZZZZ
MEAATKSEHFGVAGPLQQQVPRGVGHCGK